MTSICNKYYWILLLLPLTFLCCKDAGFKPERIKGEQLQVDQNIQENQAIVDYIAPYKKSIDDQMNSILAYAPVSLSKKDSPYNTAIGNMMADAVFEMANPVFTSRTGYPFNAVLLNYGGIRATLNSGNITTKTAYELMPFENEVVVVELSGATMKKLFNYLAQGTAHPIAGMSLILNKDGSIKEHLIQGEPVVDNNTYFIATNDYLQQGGDNMTFLTNPISKLTLDYKVRNVLIDYFKKYDTIAPMRDKRFIKLEQ
ncbi:hypothetical protein EAX61_15770 [Dokdonia sinensis]|uniref:5'-Nucleotidase C-terminal domain-containing protein n=1 Tax=Dokdonia sinensis TaxID=2479847 RepID=A0A3M0FU09_9FLAO|nr:5'-nucleotidase [Dokdonia sinensis]RMB56141.1 hypothetical protein EAX61_15770 [Dokdonia sinensis]